MKKNIIIKIFVYKLDKYSGEGGEGWVVGIGVMEVGGEGEARGSKKLLGFLKKKDFPKYLTNRI